MGGARLALTASIGIALCPDDGDAPPALIQRADAAMYRAKKHGRRGFKFHDETHAIGPEGM